MLVFISGGVRSGKSTLGEKISDELAGGRKIYLATSIAYDDEMKHRIALHREKRHGKGFMTIEKSMDIIEVSDELLPDDTVLLDCLGNLLANEMFRDDRQVDTDDVVNKIFYGIKEINSNAKHLIVISNDVFSDGCRYSDSVIEYIDALAMLHIKTAALSDRVIECSFGNRIVHKDRI